MYQRSSSSLAMAKSYSTRSSTRKYHEPSMANLRFKLATIICNHQQMKLSFHHLKSQIKSGLLEAEDVFASLAVPLMKLVGLKTGEMAEEGRFSTFITENKEADELMMPAESHYKEDDYASKATLIGTELVQKQKLQITELIRLLKQIETLVNSSRNDIKQTISDQRVSMERFFKKIMTVLASTHQAGRGTNHDILFTAKLLRATFEHVNLAFDSVEGGVEILVHNLGDQMCAPMMEYAKCLKAEMTAGPVPQLLVIVEKMRGELRNRQLKLEQERRKVREAEERRLKALIMLKKSEDSTQKMKDYLSSVVTARSECLEYFPPHKLNGVDQDQAGDEVFLWELLNKKRKYQKSDSPLGPQELNCIGFNNYSNHKSKRVRPEITSRPVTKSYARGPAPCLDSRPLLGSSPSVVTQKILTCRRMTH